MAESITEGTLKQWTKQVGDTVEQDEEVATIETDKVRVCETLLGVFTWAGLLSKTANTPNQIDVSVNAPKAGKIVELLAKEEDTVSVGQDLFKIEPGEGGGGTPTCFSRNRSTKFFPSQRPLPQLPRKSRLLLRRRTKKHLLPRTRRKTQRLQSPRRLLHQNQSQRRRSRNQRRKPKTSRHQSQRRASRRLLPLLPPRRLRVAVGRPE